MKLHPHPDKPHTWMSGDDLKAHIRAEERMRPCFCRGPQNGEPLCPCQMRDVEVRDGRYVTVIDHGPVRK